MLARIGAEVGLVPSSLVERFGSRDRILFALAERVADTAAADLVLTDGDPRTPAAALIEALLALARPVAAGGSLEHHRALLRLDMGGPGFEAMADRRARALRAVASGLLEEAVRQGELIPCDAERLARSMLALVDGAMVTASNSAAPDLTCLREDLECLIAPHRASRHQAALGGAERRRLGQFATPAPLADALARLAFAALNRRSAEPVRALDPAVGSGALVAALLRTAGDRPLSLTGVEVDPRFADAAEALWGGTGLEVLRGDFTRLAPPGRGADVVVANPPYTRHHHIDRAAKTRTRRVIRERLGLDIHGLAGLHVRMVLLADTWMAEGGIGAWLLPSEWMTASHGEALRQYLTERVTLLQVHRFDANASRFDDATVSSGIIVFRREPPPASHSVAITGGVDPLRPEARSMVRIRELPLAGWGALANVPRSRNEELRLSDLFEIKRGIATGANAYFIRTRESWRKLGIHERWLVPILPSPRALTTDEVEAGSCGEPVLADPLALLRCDLAPEEVECDETLWRYLNSPEAEVVRGRKSSRSSRPWFTQERRDPAPLLVPCFGRSAGGGSPWRVITNSSEAVAPNSYLMLYPRGSGSGNASWDAQILKRVSAALRSTLEEHHREHGRAYGGGLRKIEPRELGRLPGARVQAAADG